MPMSSASHPCLSGKVFQHVVLAISCIIPLYGIFTISVGAEKPSPPFQIISTGPGLSLHKEMFMLPATLSDAYKGRQTEVVFQISAKHRLFSSRFYFGYTQISFWQAYDHNNSAPFRETNYNPELFYRTRLLPFASGYLGGDIGFEHESNGQKAPLSRSWNLIYVSPYYYRANVLLYLKFRYRIPEEKKKYPESNVGDDNPDITDYLGYNDVNVYYEFPWKHAIHFFIRGNISTGKGGIVLTYSVPLPRGVQSFFCLRFSSGYGESLIDYNRNLTRVGLGIMFSR